MIQKKEIDEIIKEEMVPVFKECENAEVNIIGPNQKLIKWDHGGISNDNMNSDEVAYLILYVSKLGSKWDGKISLEEAMLRGI